MSSDGTQGGALHPGRCVRRIDFDGHGDAGGDAAQGPPVALAAYGDTTCALRPDGAVWCWGFGKDGELANGAAATSTTPVEVPLSPVRPHVGGHLPLVRANRPRRGRVLGQQRLRPARPERDARSSHVPVTVPLAGAPIAIAAGGHVSCAVLAITRCGAGAAITLARPATRRARRPRPRRSRCSTASRAPPPATRRRARCATIARCGAGATTASASSATARQSHARRLGRSPASSPRRSAAATRAAARYSTTRATAAGATATTATAPAPVDQRSSRLARARLDRAGLSALRHRQRSRLCAPERMDAAACWGLDFDGAVGGGPRASTASSCPRACRRRACTSRHRHGRRTLVRLRRDGTAACWGASALGSSEAGCPR